MPAAVNHFKKNKKNRSPPASPFLSPLASPPATDPGFPRPPPPRQSLAGNHADASLRIPVPPRRSCHAVEGGHRADMSLPAVVEVPASWPWWRSTAGSGCSTTRSTEEEGAAARSMGEEVTAAGSMEEEVVVVGSGERKREE